MADIGLPKNREEEKAQKEAREVKLASEEIQASSDAEVLQNVKILKGFSGKFGVPGEQVVLEKGVLKISDGIAAPDTDSQNAQIYVDTSDGDLKVKFGDGTVKTLATDT